MIGTIRVILTAALVAIGGWGMTAGDAAAETAWDFTFTSIDGEPMPLSAWRGKALLVVNTASRCAFNPQSEGLQAPWQHYRNRAMVVIGVPPTAFCGEAQGRAAQIHTFCATNYTVAYPMNDKAQ